MKRLHELCHSSDAAAPDTLRSDAPRGPARQRPDRQRESRLRRHVVHLVHDVHEQGRPFNDVAQRLRLSTRTLRDWRAEHDNQAPAVVSLGRPTVRSPRVLRSNVLAVLDELGPRTGVPTLRDSFPQMPRAELEDLLRRYRRVWRKRHQGAMSVLHWQAPGAVWAIDFSEAPLPIDGRFPYLLAVRDLASGMSLLWQPVEHADAEHTVAALRALFAQHGPPLVLKTDNGSPFGADLTQNFLLDSNVICLFSPPHTPRYNGAIEAGIGSLKIHSERHAQRQGHPGYWTSDDLAAAQAEANVTARPQGPTGPTPDDLWLNRSKLTPEQRTRFQADVMKLRLEIQARDGHALQGPLSITLSRLIDREAVRRVLVDHGFLLFRRRRIPLPFNSKKAADIR